MTSSTFVLNDLASLTVTAGSVAVAAGGRHRGVPGAVLRGAEPRLEHLTVDPSPSPGPPHRHHQEEEEDSPPQDEPHGWSWRRLLRPTGTVPRRDPPAPCPQPPPLGGSQAPGQVTARGAVLGQPPVWFPVDQSPGRTGSGVGWAEDIVRCPPRTGWSLVSVLFAPVPVDFLCCTSWRFVL